jgi:hypothetical protein
MVLQLYVFSDSLECIKATFNISYRTNLECGQTNNYRSRYITKHYPGGKTTYRWPQRFFLPLMVKIISLKTGPADIMTSGTVIVIGGGFCCLQLNRYFLFSNKKFQGWHLFHPWFASRIVIGGKKTKYRSSLYLTVLLTLSNAIAIVLASFCTLPVPQ